MCGGVAGGLGVARAVLRCVCVRAHALRLGRVRQRAVRMRACMVCAERGGAARMAVPSITVMYQI